MTAGLIPLDRLEHLVLHAMAGAMDGDDDEIAANVRPLFDEGDATDGFAFLCGVFAAIEQLTGGRPGVRLGLRFVREDDDGGTQVTEPDRTPPDVVACGRLLTAYLNRDDTAVDLWRGAILAGDAGSVLLLALDQAGGLLRARRDGAA